MDEKTEEESINLTALIFDAITNNDLSGIPALGILSSVGKIYSSVQERIFAEKVEAFFKSSEADPKTLNDFKLSIQKDEPEFVKKLWVIIDRLDAKEKAEILGRLLKAVFDGKLPRPGYLEICDCVTRSYIEHVKYLLSEGWKLEDPHNAYLRYKKQLAFNGLMTETIVTETQFGNSPTFSTFEPSDLGHYLLDYSKPPKEYQWV